MRTANEIMALSDEQLMVYTLSGEDGSHGLGLAAMNMRAATQMLQVNREMLDHARKWMEANLRLDNTTKELARQTQFLVRATRGIAWATWGVVVITFLTQIALIYLAAFRK
jgi:hypothetical protein